MLRVSSLVATLLLSLITAGGARADAVGKWVDELGVANGVALNETHELVLSTHVDGRLTLAMFEAANAVDHRYKSYLNVPRAGASTDADAAVDTAAHDVLVESFPTQAARLDEVYEDALVEITNGPAKTAGIALGHRVAQQALAAGGADASRPVEPYRPSAVVGVWVPTGMPTLPTSYLAMRPWFLSRVDEFRPKPPPSLNSSAYVQAFNETKALGGKRSVVRTPEQTQAAIFWQGANEIALLHRITNAPGRSLVENARLWALIMLAHDDENTILTDAKAFYSAWRPITAIRNADRDPSVQTERDPDWEPALPTPTHPEYPCGHCMHIALLMTLLKGEAGVDASSPLEFTAQHMPGVTLRLTPEEAIANCSSARIWGGMHFRFSTEVGVALGRKLGDFTLARFAGPDAR